MKPASRAIAVATAAAVALTSFPAGVGVHAQTGANAGIPMIRDAEIEQLLRDYTAPIFKAAGLDHAERPGRHHQRPGSSTHSSWMRTAFS